jgi:hypothetical protein
MEAELANWLELIIVILGLPLQAALCWFVWAISFLFALAIIFLYVHVWNMDRKKFNTIVNHIAQSGIVQNKIFL